MNYLGVILERKEIFFIFLISRGCTPSITPPPCGKGALLYHIDKVEFYCSSSCVSARTCA